ncbi:MAG: tetratricopeptide repeat protein [Muribaculaceae bacterium]|nr:tetratricopeptide repeat protein [Muribaculaceae bacterium]MDE6331856.1 tetratricopeptide repeat protein [Muribaculaceae bacterium]
MKKIVLAAAACIVAAGASAQINVVKEAERAMKGNASLEDVVKIITPAFSNPETEKLAQTYYVPGKAAFNNADQLLVQRQLGQLDEKGIVAMANDLIEGYNYFMKAFPLDSVPDAKGKVKTKYSKDMVNVLAGHYLDYNNAAIDFWGAQNFKGAYDAWTILLDMPKNPAVAKALPAERQFPDSTLSELAFNRGLAAWQIEKLDDAMNAFRQAKSMGYNKKQLYDYAIAVATQAKNGDEVLAWANEALPIYGKEDDSYIRQIINSQLEAGDYEKAKASINAAIAEDPSNSQYQWVLGIIYNYRKDELRRAIAGDSNVTLEDPRVKEIEQLHADARAAFQKAVELNPENAGAYAGLGMLVYEDAQVADAAAPVNAPQSYYDANVTPLLRKAAECYEKAVAINPEDHNSLTALRTIYYNLNDEAKMNEVEQKIKLL